MGAKQEQPRSLSLYLALTLLVLVLAAQLDLCSARRHRKKHHGHQGHRNHHHGNLGHGPHHGHQGHPTHRGHQGHPDHRGNRGHPDHQGHRGHPVHQGQRSHQGHQGHHGSHTKKVTNATQIPSFSWNPDCVKQPLGFGMFTSGAGEKAEVVTPNTKAELEEALCAKDKRSGVPYVHPVTNLTFKYQCHDDTPRVIVINRSFDFRGTFSTMRACFSSMGSKVLSADVSKYCAHKPKMEIMIDAASREPLIVGSNKTILGGGHLIGKGIAFRKVQNVILQNITFSHLNPFALWSGGAITLNSVNDVWIHRCTFKLFGQEAISTYPAENTGITVSSCFFDGRTEARDPKMKTYMWTSIGGQNSITVMNNYALQVAGRAPFTGKCALENCEFPSTVVQLVDNYFENVEANFQHIPSDSIVLSSGTKLKNVTDDSVETSWRGGYLFRVSPDQKVVTACKDDGKSCITTEQLMSPSFMRTLSPNITFPMYRVLRSLDVIVTTAQFLVC